MIDLKGNWVTEGDSGFAVSIETKKHLFSRKSAFQQIDIYDTPFCGRMLVLDGVVQLTEFDEYVYQEMLTHIPMFSHSDPRRVLVIGGGDGGVLREVARHQCVEKIDICEIDEEVINAARRFIPSTGCGFDDPRVTIHIADGSVFVKSRRDFYDVIIVDSTDPAGPGEPLFNQEFYQGMKNALREGGIIASQSESVFLHPKIVSRLLSITKKLFPVYGYAIMIVPTYPAGNIGACIGSSGNDIRNPVREPDAAMQAVLKCYTPDIHRAAFKLPKFAENLIAAL
ncbi:MAG: polyamine aminopropyltransferase [Victivallaceae bacterium]